jgi:hypothetical protein
MHTAICVTLYDMRGGLSALQMQEQVYCRPETMRLSLQSRNNSLLLISFLFHSFPFLPPLFVLIVPGFRESCYAPSLFVVRQATLLTEGIAYCETQFQYYK